MAPKQDYYSYALDSESRLISAEKAIKGNEYRCPNCGGIMIPKQGEKRVRVWHFAHKANTENCSYETYLHNIAKRRICECFNESAHFMIQYQSKVRCNADCPLGAKQPCEWNDINDFDLKQYYDECEEEKQVDDFRADLLISNSKIKNREPILIEIWVTHRSTEEKLNSGLRIIEIHIEYEEDIDQIVDTSSIIQNEVQRKAWGEVKQNDKIQFYNFKTISKTPDDEHQSNKHVFWIDTRGKYQFSDEVFDNIQLSTKSLKCQESNPPEIENSIFRIESCEPINKNFAYYKLAHSGLCFSFCKTCKNYEWKGNTLGCGCILNKSNDISQYIALSITEKCQDFNLSNIFGLDGYFAKYPQECKITIKK